jgi:hypothetical protein
MYLEKPNSPAARWVDEQPDPRLGLPDPGPGGTDLAPRRPPCSPPAGEVPPEAHQLAALLRTRTSRSMSVGTGSAPRVCGFGSLSVILTAMGAKKNLRKIRDGGEGRCCRGCLVERRCRHSSASSNGSQESWPAMAEFGGGGYCPRATSER